MEHSGLERTSWMASLGRGVGMTVAVVAALLLGVVAAAYARAGDHDPTTFSSTPSADPRIR